MPGNATAPNLLALSQREAQELLRSHYDLEVDGLELMDSELSSVYKATSVHGELFAFKANLYSAEALQIDQWRVGAMMRLQARGIPVGQIRSDIRGDLVSVTEKAGQPITMHLGEWLEGKPLEEVIPTRRILRSVGHTAADVASALDGWPQPPIAVSHVWELRRTGDSLINAMSRVEDPQLWSILDESRTRFLSVFDGRMDGLPHGVVHHDLHDANLLVDASEEAVTGVLDFGDMVWGPRIAELAVPAAYASRGAAQPVEAFIQVAEGWGDSIDLQADEIDLLFEAAIGRLAVNLAVWTARGQSERGGYARSRSNRTERVLREFLRVDADALRRELRQILGH